MIETVDNDSDNQKMARNLSRAKEFAEKLHPLRASYCGCNGTDAYAVAINKQNGFSLTATWQETFDGQTMLRAWIEYESPLIDSETAQSELLQFMKTARGDSAKGGE